MAWTNRHTTNHRAATTSSRDMSGIAAMESQSHR
uniref:Uncharacterized protein n=1 Tax=Arundo donax TaxID=35708 RepID=A0A0A9FHW3_ARUDO